MATIISDYPTTSLSFSDVVSTTQHSDEAQYSLHCHSHTPRSRRTDSPHHQKPIAVTVKNITCSSIGGTERLPSPPSSASKYPNIACSSHYEITLSTMVPEAQNSALIEPSASNGDDVELPIVRNSMPSPNSDDHLSRPVLPPKHSSQNSAAEPNCQIISVQDLKHIHDLAKDHDMGNGPGILKEPTLQSMKYDISCMPIHDIIEMVAALLTKITTTNDFQHDAMSRNAAHQEHAASSNQSNHERSPFSSSVLAFHGKNVPAISILNYLARIHKYCPTTYEVFLSLLVYFDRMTERVNEIVMRSELERKSRSRIACPQQECNISTHKYCEDGLIDQGSSFPGTSAAEPTINGPAPTTYFVVDSFNIHRLIIAGVTCASKFFSDIFYTNSRYAKVGGLPLNELNHLEIQFLILNDFRLSVAVEDLEAYATMLVEFYAREVVSTTQQSVTAM